MSAKTSTSGKSGRIALAGAGRLLPHGTNLRGVGRRGRRRAGGGLGFLVARRAGHRAAAVVGLPAPDERAAGDRGRRPRHPDRRGRGPGRIRDVPGDHGRHRILAAECREGHRTPASPGRRGDRRSGRAAAPLRRRGLRPGHQQASGHRLVGRDRPRIAHGRNLFRTARRSCERLRTGRVLPRPAARGPPRARSARRGRRRRGRGPAHRRPARRTTAHGVRRYRRGGVLPAQGRLDGPRVHRRGPPRPPSRPPRSRPATAWSSPPRPWTR